MAVPGRISDGPGGPAESALLPATKGSKRKAMIGRLHLQVGVVDRLAHALGQRHPPRCVDSSAERRVNDDADGARLIPELLDDDVLVVRHDPRGRSLRRDVFHQ